MKSMIEEAMDSNAKAAAGPNMEKVKDLFPIGSECTCDYDGLYGEVLVVVGHSENMMSTPIVDVKTERYDSVMGYYAHELKPCKTEYIAMYI